MRPGTIRRASWIVAAVAGLAGAILWLLPPNDTTPALAPVAIGTMGLPVAASNPAVAEDIVVANVFAASRTAPATRYSPGEGAGESSSGAMMPTDASFEDTEPVAGGPRLLGTVVSPDGPRALLQLNPTIPGSRLYAEGEEDAGYRIMSITPRVVVLRGPGGRVTLRLDPEEDRL
jgi:hypothetical protein